MKKKLTDIANDLQHFGSKSIKETGGSTTEMPGKLGSYAKISKGSSIMLGISDKSKEEGKEEKSGWIQPGSVFGMGAKDNSSFS
jgi:hypothetical protein